MDLGIVILLWVTGLSVALPLIAACFYIVREQQAEKHTRLTKRNGSDVDTVALPGINYALRGIDLERIAHSSRLRDEFLCELEKRVSEKEERALADRETLRGKLAKRTPDRHLLDEMEKRVTDKEQRARERHEVDQYDLPDPISKRIDHLAYALKYPAKLHARFAAFMSKVDPNIDRAYRRLCKQREIAGKLADASLLVEKRLEIDFALAAEKQSLAKMAAIEQAVDTDQEQMTSPENPDDLHSFDELSWALKMHRRKNAQISDVLFRIDRLFRRLLVLKLVLSSLPGRLPEEVLEFKSLLNDFTALLNRSEEKQPSINAPNLKERLKTLETNTMHTYINLLKAAERLSVKEKDKLLDKIGKINSVVDSELSDEKDQLAAWQNVAALTSSQGKNLAAEIARERQAECQEVINCLSTAVDVLAVCLQKLEPQSPD